MRTCSRSSSRSSRRRGVHFRYGVNVESLRRRRSVGGVRCHARTDAGGPQADAYVVALGSYSPFLLAAPRARAVYPAKGYSSDDRRRRPPGRAARVAHRSRVEDRADAPRQPPARRRHRRTVRLGMELNPLRCEALKRRTFEIFPAPATRERSFWTGLRPATPSNVPLIGATRYPNLWLDTGHGTLGWTMACGSGRRSPTRSWTQAARRFRFPASRARSSRNCCSRSCGTAQGAPVVKQSRGQ